MTGPTVLVVDDDATSVEGLIQQLQAMNFLTATATSGREALGRIKACPPDLILLDAVMPDMDGFELCRAVQSDLETASVPVIFLSARKTLGDRAMSLLLGARASMSTPPAASGSAGHEARAARGTTQADGLQWSRGHIARDRLVDPLTRVLNRRGLETHLLQEVERARRYRTPLSCVMLAPDTRGPAGERNSPMQVDETSQELAASLVTCCRPTDFVARYGGEEFTVLLPHTPREGAIACAERIRRSVAGQKCVGQTTISLGVAEFTAGDDGHALLERADCALYDAKAAGGNCVRGS